jgi:hypothetical protein
MEVRRGAGLLLVGMVAFSGCGASLGGPSSCDANCWQPTPDEQSFISAYCAMAAACCASDGFVESDAETACANGLRRGGVSADPSVRAACLAEMQSLAGSPTCVPDRVDPADPCYQAKFMTSGPHQPGESCAADSDCAGAPGTITRCGGDPNVAKVGHAVCIRMKPGKAGDHTCLGNASAGVVTYFAFYDYASDETISTGYYCDNDDGVYCNPTSDATLRACTTYLPGGSGCGSGQSCASGTCEPAAQVDAAGDPGTCAFTSTIGGSCNPGAICDGVSVCDQSVSGSYVCVARSPAQAACGSNDDCMTGNCDPTGHCAVQTYAEARTLSVLCAGAL